MPNNNTSCLLARQPIFDRQLDIRGYELLFRSADGNGPLGVTGDQASSEVMIAAFTELPLAVLLEDKPAFINFTRNLLTTPPPFDARQLTIEILEDIPIDEALVADIRELKNRGHQIALDDFVWKPGTELLLPLVDIIKLEVNGLGPEVLEERLQPLRDHGVTLLAEKIETHEEFQQCLNAGFDLFQGYFLSRPEVVSGSRFKENQISVLQLLAHLNNEDCELTQLESIIASDPVLSYKLLKMSNSLQFWSGRPVDSLRRAIMMLGLQKIRSWATLLALTKLQQKPRALMESTLVRARFCQRLGEKIKPNSADKGFTIGLLSTLDAFMDQPLPSLLEGLKVSVEIEEALLHHKGTLGLILTTACAYETADWDRVDWGVLRQGNITTACTEDAYLESLQWAAETLRMLGD